MGPYTIPQILTFLEQGGFLVTNFNAYRNQERVVSTDWMCLTNLPLMTPLSTFAFLLFYYNNRLPYVVAHLTAGYRRDEFPFPLGDLQVDKLEHSSWWAEDTPSPEVIYWLELTARQPFLEEYFGDFIHWPGNRAYQKRQLTSSTNGPQGRIKLKAMISDTRSHFMSQWTWTGYIKVYFEKFEEDLSDWEKLSIWVQSMGVSKLRMKELESPFLFKFYCAARCLLIVQAAAADKFSFTFNRPMPCGGWEIYPKFAIYGPHMARMYNWLVRSGFMFGEDPKLRMARSKLHLGDVARKEINARIRDYVIRRSNIELRIEGSEEQSVLTDSPERGSSEEREGVNDEEEFLELTAEQWQEEQSRKRTREECGATNPCDSPPRSKRRRE